jgi:hypothetical protein
MPPRDACARGAATVLGDHEFAWIVRGARAVLGDEQDQIGHPGLSVQGELPANVLGCPESHELHQPAAGLFGAVLEREIRKH